MTYLNYVMHVFLRTLTSETKIRAELRKTECAIKVMITLSCLDTRLHKLQLFREFRGGVKTTAQVHFGIIKVCTTLSQINDLSPITKMQYLFFCNSPRFQQHCNQTGVIG